MLLGSLGPIGAAGMASGVLTGPAFLATLIAAASSRPGMKWLTGGYQTPREVAKYLNEHPEILSQIGRAYATQPGQE